MKQNGRPHDLAVRWRILVPCRELLVEMVIVMIKINPIDNQSRVQVRVSSGVFTCYSTRGDFII